MKLDVGNEKKLQIVSEGDIVAVRKAVRSFAGEMGFRMTDITRIVTAASELARNIYRYAGTGMVSISVFQDPNRKGLKIEFKDQGPGIPDIDHALEMGSTTGGGLGLGLPGAKRLMDEMHIESHLGQGTTVDIVKWIN